MKSKNSHDWDGLMDLNISAFYMEKKNKRVKCEG